MSEKEKIKKELDDLSPLLSKLKQDSDNPFGVPNHYFESLQDEVLRQVSVEQVDVQVVEPGPSWLDRLVEQLQWLFQPRYAMAMATVAILIVAGIFFFRGETSSPGLALQDLSEEDITDYISSNIEDFEVDLLVEAMGDEIDPALLPKPDLEDAELEEYLDEIIDEIDLEELEDLL